MDNKPKKNATKKPVKKLTEQQQRCLDCRECCEYTEFPITMLSPKVVEYYTMRGNKFYINNTGVMHIRLKNPCQHLSETGCAIYNERPHFCVDFMCAEKDNSIRAVKDAACEKCLAEVKVVIEEHYRKEKEKSEGYLEALKNKEGGKDDRED